MLSLKRNRRLYLLGTGGKVSERFQPISYLIGWEQGTVRVPYICTARVALRAGTHKLCQEHLS